MGVLHSGRCRLRPTCSLDSTAHNLFSSTCLQFVLRASSSGLLGDALLAVPGGLRLVQCPLPPQLRAASARRRFARACERPVLRHKTPTYVPSLVVVSLFSLSLCPVSPPSRPAPSRCILLYCASRWLDFPPAFVTRIAFWGPAASLGCLVQYPCAARLGYLAQPIAMFRA